MPVTPRERAKGIPWWIARNGAETPCKTADLMKGTTSFKWNRSAHNYSICWHVNSARSCLGSQSTETKLNGSRAVVFTCLVYSHTTHCLYEVTWMLAYHRYAVQSPGMRHGIPPIQEPRRNQATLWTHCKFDSVHVLCRLMLRNTTKSLCQLSHHLQSEYLHVNQYYSYAKWKLWCNFSDTLQRTPD